MFGFLMMMLVFVALISVISYWISWDLQDKNERPAFTIKIWTDLVALLGKCRDLVRNAGSRTVAGRPDGTANAGRRQGLDVAAPSAASVANRS